MNRYHQELLDELKREAEDNPFHSSQDTPVYTGNQHPSYPLRTPQRRNTVKSWLKQHPDLANSELTDLLDSLYQGESSDEKYLAGMLIDYLPQFRKTLKPVRLDVWLDDLEGWAEVDSLCQSNFSADDLLANWPAWQKQIDRFSRDANINKRRASLVLLTGPVWGSDDRRLAQLAFSCIERLKHEREILITKAISWLLRDLIKHHRNQVVSYLDQNADSLPPIAVRETRRKLATGRK